MIDYLSKKNNMQHIASFDIGIKYMAFCVIQKPPAAAESQNTFHICDWAVLNLSTDDCASSSAPQQRAKVATTATTTTATTICCCIGNCKRKAARIHAGKMYCVAHTTPDTRRVLPIAVARKWMKLGGGVGAGGGGEADAATATAAVISAAANKQFLAFLETAAPGIAAALDADADFGGPSSNRRLRKSTIKNIIKQHFWIPIAAAAVTGTGAGAGAGAGAAKKNSSAKSVDLITVSRRLTKALDDAFAKNGALPSLTEIRIENQIGPLATRMKTIQGMVTQYFVMRAPHAAAIRYFSSAQKLKIDLDFDEGRERNQDQEKKTYRARKSRGIELCRDVITRADNTSLWGTFFDAHKKKDDLADCMLQALF